MSVAIPVKLLARRVSDIADHHDFLVRARGKRWHCAITAYLNAVIASCRTGPRTNGWWGWSCSALPHPGRLSFLREIGEGVARGARSSWGAAFARLLTTWILIFGAISSTHSLPRWRGRANASKTHTCRQTFWSWNRQVPSTPRPASRS
jgi:hypothetical protein